MTIATTIRNLGGSYQATVDGEIIVRAAKNPLVELALRLLDRGVDPDETLLVTLEWKTGHVLTSCPLSSLAWIADRPKPSPSAPRNQYRLAA